jgi:hypothetical protein
VIWFQERSPCKVPDPVWRSYHRMHELEKLPAGNVEVTRRNKLQSAGIDMKHLVLHCSDMQNPHCKKHLRNHKMM